jgi:hypothetical protein
MLNFLLGWRNKWRRLGAHLEQHGERAPATVVEISKWGSTHSSEGWSMDDEMLARMPGESLAPSNTAEYVIRKTRLRVRPADATEFEVECKMRYGDWGGSVPKAGDEIDVIFDPDDHQKVMVAPPTQEEEALRTAEALGKADIGVTIGGHGAKPGTGKAPSDEQMADYAQQMDTAQSMLEQAQKFMSGDAKPGDDPAKKPDEERDS